MAQNLQSGGTDHIGRYRILRRLGEGGMGEVLLGVGPDGRLVAIKRVHAHLLERDDFLPRFRREVQASAKVSGAFTAAVVDFDVSDENPWFASVFVPGVPLDKAVERYGPLPLEAVHALALGLATALQAIHGVGLVHRDLKPANIILAQDGPRVIDFGIARIGDERSELTHTGTIIGSPAFMSPEQAESKSLTAASDVFSLGSVIVMAATGKSPFAGTSMPHILYSIVNTEPDLSTLPPEVRQLVEPCLNKDPQQRPTPSHIIDFLGPLTASGAPWPQQIREAMQVQENELRSLVADPESTMIVDPTPSSVTTLGGDFDAKIRELSAAHQKPHSRRWILAVLVAVLVLVAGGVTAAVTIGSGGKAAAPVNPLGGLDMTKLRLIDTCTLLHDPIGPSLGAWTDSPPGTPEPNCVGNYAEYMVAIDIPSLESIGLKVSEKRIQGVPEVVPSVPESTGCTRGLEPATMDPQFAITISVTAENKNDSVAVRNQCALAEQAITNLIPKLRNPPLIANSRHTITRLDPCSVVPPIALKLNIGQPGPGTPSDLHGCLWVSENTLSVDLVHQSPPTGDPVSNGEFKLWGSDFDSNTQCNRIFVWGNFDNGGADRLEVSVGRNSGATEQQLCAAAESVATKIGEQLPKP